MSNISEYSCIIFTCSLRSCKCFFWYTSTHFIRYNIKWFDFKFTTHLLYFFWTRRWFNFNICWLCFNLRNIIHLNFTSKISTFLHNTKAHISLFYPFFSTSRINIFITSISKFKNHTISFVLAKLIINFMLCIIWTTNHIYTFFRTWKNTKITIHTFWHIYCKSTNYHLFLSIIWSHTTIKIIIFFMWILQSGY